MENMQLAAANKQLEEDMKNFGAPLTQLLTPLTHSFPLFLYYPHPLPFLFTFAHQMVMGQCGGERSRKENGCIAEPACGTCEMDINWSSRTG
jgi:hypothetical protein